MGKASSHEISSSKVDSQSPQDKSNRNTLTAFIKKCLKDFPFSVTRLVPRTAYIITNCIQDSVDD